MYNISTNFRIFLFIPILIALLVNTGCVIFGMLFVALVGKDEIVLFSEIYILLIVIMNIAFFLGVIYLSNKFVKDNILNALDLFYKDMQCFYKSSQDDFSSWSQQIITSPQEVMEISRYFLPLLMSNLKTCLYFNLREISQILLLDDSSEDFI